MKALKSRHFWGGVITALILVAFVPQANPRTWLAKPKKAA